MDAHHNLAELNARIDALQADLTSKQEIASALSELRGAVKSIDDKIALSDRFAKIEEEHESELPGERNDIVARIYSFDGQTTKFTTVPLPLFSFHFAAPFTQSVQHQTVSL